MLKCVEPGGGGDGLADHPNPRLPTRTRATRAWLALDLISFVRAQNAAAGVNGAIAVTGIEAAP